MDGKAKKEHVSLNNTGSLIFILKINAAKKSVNIQKYGRIAQSALHIACLYFRFVLSVWQETLVLFFFIAIQWFGILKQLFWCLRISDFNSLHPAKFHILRFDEIVSGSNANNSFPEDQRLIPVPPL